MSSAQELRARLRGIPGPFPELEARRVALDAIAALEAAERNRSMTIAQAERERDEARAEVAALRKQMNHLTRDAPW